MLENFIRLRMPNREPSSNSDPTPDVIPDLPPAYEELFRLGKPGQNVKIFVEKSKNETFDSSRNQA